MATLLSLLLATWVTAQQDTGFVEWAEYEAAPALWDVLAPKVFSNPEVIPSSEEMSEAFPDISQAALTAFIQNFDTLGDAEKAVFLADFMNLSDTDRNLALRIYQSAYESVTHPILKKVLVKTSIGLPDVIENVQYAIDNGWDIRDGEPVEVMFVLENIIEKFPETRAVLDDEFISETQALYDNMSESVLTRLAEAERTLENARNGIFEDHITLDDLGITIEGYSWNARLNDTMAEIEARTQASRERLEILREEGRKLDAFIAQLRALEAAGLD